jgi:branched-subunit amino acid aminotransferase/4-amino-4-deoxychorismate lyase
MFLNTHFPKARKYWYQGRFYDWSEADFHPMMHALHYGTSVFEGIRAYSTPRGPAVFRLPEHNDRFFVSAAVAKMKPPYAKEEVFEFVKLTVRENELDSCYIRPLLFYSYGNLGLVPKACPVELAISAWEWGAYLGENAARGVNAYIVPWRRVHHTQFNMTAKLGGVYVQSTICGLEAREEGFDEAIFLNFEGRVAEGPGQNISSPTTGRNPSSRASPGRAFSRSAGTWASRPPCGPSPRPTSSARTRPSTAARRSRSSPSSPSRTAPTRPGRGSGTSSGRASRDRSPCG